MATTPRTLTVAEAADRLGVAPARIRALVAGGALPATPDGTVPAAELDGLARRGVVRSLDVAAVEGALDRALRRRLPDLLGSRLEQALSPLASEVATALLDVESSSGRIAAADERAAAAERALAAAAQQVADLEARLAVLEAQPAGLFRRRRRRATATA